jgi:preprotein translocase subunit SecD
MIIGATKFNLYLLLAAVLCLAGGCETGRDKTPVAAIQFHIETTKDGTSLNKPVPIYRANPVLINVDVEPFLTEDDVTSARLVDTNGGFMMNIKFNDSGASTLEQYTSDNPGRHIAVYCAYGEKLKETRWLAAPQIHRRISDGQLTFTPDATRDESKLIVESLNNLIAEKKKRHK